MKRNSVLASYEPVCEPVVDAMSNQSCASEGITISCYENDVPSFVGAEMSRLYGSIYSSLAQFHIYTDGTDTSTYIVRSNGKINTVFLFKQQKGKVRVLNEVININEQDILRFAAYVFANFASAKVISFKAIQTNLCRISFPYQRLNALEDIVVTLPASADEYLASLGKNTRRNVKRYTKRLLESFPSFQYEVLIGKDVDEQTIRTVVGLNRARMADKNKVSAIDDEETERLVLLAKECGLVGVARIDGRICAGGISFRAGKNYFLSVLAHDPAYDDFWIGILCCYFTICECIARGGKEFHFLWGQYEYKTTLLGVKRDLDNLVIYRSHTQVLLNGDIALRMAVKGYARRAHLWLHDVKRQDNFMSRLAMRSFNHLRNLRQLGRHVPAGRK